MKTILKIIAAICFAGVVVQFIPITKDNPPVTGEIAVSEKVQQIVKRSCYDCHSNETKWPWYSRIAPISWLVARDVKEGRQNLNFSTWQNLAKAEQENFKNRIQLEVSEDSMPPFIYKLGHPDAKMSENEKEAIIKWASKKNPS